MLKPIASLSLALALSACGTAQHLNHQEASTLLTVCTPGAVKLYDTLSLHFFKGETYRVVAKDSLDDKPYWLVRFNSAAGPQFFALIDQETGRVARRAAVMGETGFNSPAIINRDLLDPSAAVLKTSCN